MSLPEHLALVSKRLRRANGPWARHVLYIDRGILVLNKPPGLVSQASAPQNHAGSASEYDALIHQLKTHLQLDELYPVHRLDKPTTGALVLARTKHLAQELSRQFRSRAIDKTYLALVRGGEKTFPARSGTIQGHLHFDDGRVSIAAGPAKEGTKPALTEWELLSSSVRPSPLL
ncbi:hypothetical protein EWM64_g441 [Hericium alpestre]|uniref:21S rRNA pseudouridine(2819) synthase n=1 Tax=Hericium alpestre TaxID=135208 RepID=A0A4Z0AB62_9AGAM|nr:hypothetical protein EWM64_g441 [Hericium alpestre]